MKRVLFTVLLACMAVGVVAEAGQYRIAPPRDQRRRQPPANYRESRLEIVNDDDRGYAIDVDYRRNRLELVHRARGDIYVPARSRITLTFDDDDNWHILGDYEVLDIEIRAGRTTTLRLDTKMNRRQYGLVGTVEDGPRRYSKQLFRYADRAGPVAHQPSRPGQHQPSRPSQPPPPPAPITPPPLSRHPSAPRYQSPGPGRHEPPKGSSIGAAVGGLIEGLVDNKNRR